MSEGIKLSSGVILPVDRDLTPGERMVLCSTNQRRLCGCGSCIGLWATCAHSTYMGGYGCRQETEAERDERVTHVALALRSGVWL